MILLNQLQLYAKQILNDYDKKKPSVLFKNNINITRTVNQRLFQCKMNVDVVLYHFRQYEISTKSVILIHRNKNVDRIFEIGFRIIIMFLFFVL